jgi:2-hydroxy-4-carboxymuconate semialdehyde hemiacetal dehydrogenase
MTSSATPFFERLCPRMTKKNDDQNDLTRLTMKICVAGQGAFGQKHLDALKRIPEVEVTSLVGGNQDATAQVAQKYGVPHFTGELSEGIKRADAVILTTPTKLHFRQGEQVMRAGKHVLVEIPVTDSVEDAEALVKIAKETGVVAMGGHVRRFNPSHQWVHKRIQKGELKIQQMDVQTYFFRRKNINAAGQPRSWTDHLLWHHAAHTIDLFQYQAGETISDCYAVQGPIHPQLNIAMDMGIVAKTPSGAVLTLSLSFNNDGPLGSFFRYICDNGTYKAYYDDLSDGKDNKIDLSKVDVSMDGIELEDREFIAAIKQKREPNASLAALLPCMHVLGRLEKIVDPQRKAHA